MFHLQYICFAHSYYLSLMFELKLLLSTSSLILVNEAENYSKEEMLLILTRVGEGSKIILTGDLEQCDRKDIKKSKSMCGLEYACEKLKDMEEFASIEFFPEDVVRNPLITKILKNWK